MNLSSVVHWTCCFNSPPIWQKCCNSSSSISKTVKNSAPAAPFAVIFFNQATTCTYLTLLASLYANSENLSPALPKLFLRYCFPVRLLPAAYILRDSSLGQMEKCANRVKNLFELMLARMEWSCKLEQIKLLHAMMVTGDSKVI